MVKILNKCTSVCVCICYLISSHYVVKKLIINLSYSRGMDYLSLKLNAAGTCQQVPNPYVKDWNSEGNMIILCSLCSMFWTQKGISKLSTQDWVRLVVPLSYIYLYLQNTLKKHHHRNHCHFPVHFLILLVQILFWRYFSLSLLSPMLSSYRFHFVDSS